MPSWKKIIVSGSNAELNQLTATSYGGNISGSATSTGSFGFVTGNKLGIGTTSPDHFAHLVMDGNDRLLIQNISAGSDSTIELKANAKSSFIFNNPSTGHLFIRTDVGTEDVILQNNDSGNVGIGNLTEASEKLHVVGNVFATGNISGSATSTGSFGRVEATKLVGDGSGITGLTSAAISSYTNNGNNRIITSVNSSTVNGEANLTFDGSTLDVTGDLTLSGDLTVNGTTTTIATTNLQIQDAFGFFATGSAGTNVDAGIIVQSGSFVDSGSALYHDISSERWSVGKGIASTATNVPDSKWGGFVATVYTASASPVGSSPKYGVGEIHVDDDGEIYIYS